MRMCLATGPPTTLNFFTEILSDTGPRSRSGMTTPDLRFASSGVDEGAKGVQWEHASEASVAKHIPHGDAALHPRLGFHPGGRETEDREIGVYRTFVNGIIPQGTFE